MAKVFIECYDKMGRLWAGNEMIAAPSEPSSGGPLTPVAIGGVSAQSAVFPDGTRLIRVHTDAICSIKIGANPTATADDKRMAANATEYFGVTPGHKLAVITNT